MKTKLFTILLVHALAGKAQEPLLMLNQQKMNVKATMRGYELIYKAKDYLEYNLAPETNVTYHFEKYPDRYPLDPVWICSKCSVTLPEAAALAFIEERTQKGIWKAQADGTYLYYTGVFIRAVTVRITEFPGSMKIEYYFD